MTAETSFTDAAEAAYDRWLKAIDRIADLERDLTAAREQIAELDGTVRTLATVQTQLIAERDAARARVAELEAGLRKTAEALSAITGDFNMTRMMMNDATTRDLAGEIVKDSRACVDAARALLAPSPEPKP